MIIQLMVVALVAAVAIVATPIGNAFQSELQNPNATEDRFELYQATLRELPESPVIGFGGPRVVQEGLPPAGTHGQVWIVLFSHGAAGTLAYFGFLCGLLWSTRNYRTRTGLWCHVVVFVSLVQAPFYGHVPQQLGIIMVAGAIGILDASGSASGSASGGASGGALERRTGGGVVSAARVPRAPATAASAVRRRKRTS